MTTSTTAEHTADVITATLRWSSIADDSATIGGGCPIPCDFPTSVL
ncbi:hypothetical protein X975_06492, partial [Stegodyphus mimosarum]